MPIIGISSRLENDYIHVVEKLREVIIKEGGSPLLVLPFFSFDCTKEKVFSQTYTKKERTKLSKILEKCDGFILPGGENWYPQDEEIISYSKKNQVPILGICLGMQELSKSFFQEKKGDITVPLSNDFHYQRDVPKAHEIMIKENSKLYKIVQRKKIVVNSRHHFHIPYIDEKYISARSLDNVIEGIEDSNHPFFIGVQWHPESLYPFSKSSKKLFRSFMNSCLVYEKKRN